MRSSSRPLLSIAPMMDWTDRHYRFFIRQITKRTLLYTEMITANAVVLGNRDRLLGFSPEEHPLAIQLGGDNPQMLAEAARIAVDYGYQEVNLNVGCPSDRVQNGNFGACLMAKPELVQQCVAAMKQAVAVPITVKHRIGIDGQESYDNLAHFVSTVAEGGCDRFIVHARIAILRGLSPKENRSIPPLRYPDVYQLKQQFPYLQIEINGGIQSLAIAKDQLNHVDGVMIGRLAYEKPYEFALADQSFFSAATPPATRREIIEAMIPYLDHFAARGTPPKRITRHMLGLFTGQPGARVWKRLLSENTSRFTDGQTFYQIIKGIFDSPLVSTDLAA